MSTPRRYTTPFQKLILERMNQTGRNLTRVAELSADENGQGGIDKSTVSRLLSHPLRQMPKARVLAALARGLSLPDVKPLRDAAYRSLVGEGEDDADQQARSDIHALATHLTVQLASLTEQERWYVRWIIDMVVLGAHARRMRPRSGLATIEGVDDAMTLYDRLQNISESQRSALLRALGDAGALHEDEARPDR